MNHLVSFDRDIQIHVSEFNLRFVMSFLTLSWRMVGVHSFVVAHLEKVTM